MIPSFEYLIVLSVPGCQRQSIYQSALDPTRVVALPLFLAMVLEGAFHLRLLEQKVLDNKQKEVF